MISPLRLKEIMPGISSEKKDLEAFLRSHDLIPEDDLCYAVALVDEEDRIVACGASNRKVLKCFVVSEELRGTNALGKLIPPLVDDCMKSGCTNPLVITRPMYAENFESCGFSLIAKTDDAAFLEHLSDGVRRFAASFISPEDKGKKTGAIVLNANPFTLGHRYLIERSLKLCEVLHLFVVEEDRSVFPFADRYKLVCEGTRDLENVRVHKGGPYIISSATFPRYFLKTDDDLAAIQSELDATVFAERIAPVLGISIRFVGTEPYCALTSRYNAALKKILPQHGIEVEEIERLADKNNDFISASRVRKLLLSDSLETELEHLLPECTLQYIRSTLHGNQTTRGHRNP